MIYQFNDNHSIWSNSGYWVYLVGTLDYLKGKAGNLAPGFQR